MIGFLLYVMIAGAIGYFVYTTDFVDHPADRVAAAVSIALFWPAVLFLGTPIGLGILFAKYSKKLFQEYVVEKKK